MKFNKALFFTMVFLLPINNIIADTIAFDLKNSIFDITIGLSGDSIDATATVYDASLLSNYDTSLSINYGSGLQDFQVNSSDFLLFESTDGLYYPLSPGMVF